MKRILFYTLTTLLGVSSSVSGPNATDYFTKGSEAITALQDFNFALQYNIFTTGGAHKTIQAM